MGEKKRLRNTAFSQDRAGESSAQPASPSHQLSHQSLSAQTKNIKTFPWLFIFLHSLHPVYHCSMWSCLQNMPQISHRFPLPSDRLSLRHSHCWSRFPAGFTVSCSWCSNSSHTVSWRQQSATALLCVKVSSSFHVNIDPDVTVRPAFFLFHRFPPVTSSPQSLHSLQVHMVSLSWNATPNPRSRQNINPKLDMSFLYHLCQY